MVFVWEDLDDAIDQVRLGEWIGADHDLIQDGRQNNLPVYGGRDAVQGAQPHEIGPDQDPQLVAVLLAPAADRLGALVSREVLDADPQLIHLNEIRQDEFVRILDGPRIRNVGNAIGQLGCRRRDIFERNSVFSRGRGGSWCRCRGGGRRRGGSANERSDLVDGNPNVGQFVAKGLQQVMPQKQPSDGILNALHGLDQILEYPSGTNFSAPDERRGRAYLEIQPRKNIWTVLDAIVQLHHGVRYFGTGVGIVVVHHWLRLLVSGHHSTVVHAPVHAHAHLWVLVVCHNGTIVNVAVVVRCCCKRIGRIWIHVALRADRGRNARQLLHECVSVAVGTIGGSRGKNTTGLLLLLL
mmetsp:Transcript_65186/g.132619  ORF Transcript_65186/g.132619 Transcript_65186/m.132619 type:complete len:353 (-) Transcript_65186:190-1248(-)